MGWAIVYSTTFVVSSIMQCCPICYTSCTLNTRNGSGLQDRMEKFVRKTVHEHMTYWTDKHFDGLLHFTDVILVEKF